MKLHVEKVRLNRGGYDSHDRYYGTGQPLYEVWSEEGLTPISTRVRASDARTARKMVAIQYGIKPSFPRQRPRSRVALLKAKQADAHARELSMKAIGSFSWEQSYEKSAKAYQEAADAAEISADAFEEIGETKKADKAKRLAKMNREKQHYFESKGTTSGDPSRRRTDHPRRTPKKSRARTESGKTGHREGGHMAGHRKRATHKRKTHHRKRKLLISANDPRRKRNKRKRHARRDVSMDRRRRKHARRKHSRRDWKGNSAGHRKAARAGWHRVAKAGWKPKRAHKGRRTARKSHRDYAMDPRRRRHHYRRHA